MRKKDKKLSEKLYYSHKSHQAFYDQCANSNPLVILNNIDDTLYAKFSISGSVPSTYNTYSYVQMSESIKEYPEDTEDVESWLKLCENCDELAYDGRICHNCGSKYIGE